MHVRWLPHSLNPVFAGVRLRCLLPQAVLRSAGYDIAVASEETVVSASSILVVQAKWLLDANTPERLLQRMNGLESAKSAGATLVLDSFDNYFINDNAINERERLLQAYHTCLSRFDRFTVSSPGLRPFLRDALNSAAVIDVIGDPLEDVKTHHLYESALQIAHPGRWPGHLRSWQERIGSGFARKHGRRLMWFGNHGSNYAAGGMGELSRILPMLQDIATRHSIHLTVVSNSRRRFDEIMAPFDIPCTYREWDRLHFLPLLRIQDLVLLPINISAFTASKSNNRLLLPLSQGVPVVTDALPDYLPWREHCAIDDWGRLERYIADPGDLQARARAVAARIRKDFSVQAVADQWLAMFRSIQRL